MWRACNSCLLTAAALITKRVQIDVKCLWCRIENEDAVHVLFTCSFARSVWLEAGFQSIIQVLPDDSVMAVFKRVFAVASKEQVVQVTLPCWNIWNRRNKWVWDKINMSAFRVQAAATSLLLDWRKENQVGVQNRPGMNINSRRWNRPGLSTVGLKLTSMLPGSSDQGNFLRARSKRTGSLLQPREAEVLSLKEAMSWVKEMGFQVRKCVFETDAKQLADACKGVQDESYFHTNGWIVNFLSTLNMC
ncbi:uncharacterized protein LOC141720064 [Apium graveolens]|uniref:uncharacterized protein LOC141720064 n=1 Tax=Apium graveolens TaxID=4045 RepID=UPI003D79B5D7